MVASINQLVEVSVNFVKPNICNIIRIGKANTRPVQYRGIRWTSMQSRKFHIVIGIKISYYLSFIQLFG